MTGESLALAPTTIARNVETNTIMLHLIGNPTYLLLFIAALSCTAMITPRVMRFARRVGAVDQGGYRKVYQGAMPLLGGLSIAGPFLGLCLVSAALGYLAITYWTSFARLSQAQFNAAMTLASWRQELFTLAVGGAAIVLLGLWDDMRGMRARYKLIGQILIALFICYSDYSLKQATLPLVDEITFNLWWSNLITVLWIVGLINAFNLIDGIDGLATGTAWIIFVGMALLAAINGDLFFTLIWTTLAGCALGFLFFNFNPARIFLGDTGSMFLGFVLSVGAMMGASKGEATVIVLTPLLALGFPIFEAAISMFRRFVRGVPLFAGDQQHTHHRLLSRGYTQRQTVLLLYGVTFLCMVAAVATQLVPSDTKAFLIPVALFFLVFAGVIWLAGYIPRLAAEPLIRRRQRNKVFLAFTRYVLLALNSNQRTVKLAEILEVARVQMRLSYLAAWLGKNSTLIASSSALVSAAKAKPYASDEPDKQGEQDKQARGSDRIERLRVRTLGDQEIVIHFEFGQPVDEHERRDVTACLANLFQQLKYVSLEPSPDDQPDSPVSAIPTDDLDD